MSKQRQYTAGPCHTDDSLGYAILIKDAQGRDIARTYSFTPELLAMVEELAEFIALEHGYAHPLVMQAQELLDEVAG